MVDDTTWIAIEKTEEVIDKIYEVYDKISALPKPDSYTIGGTYYGSTQLLQHVGNMLNLIEGEAYTSHSYGGSTRYREMYGIRIGGAYEVTAIVNELRGFIREHRQEIFAAGYAIIDDHGTNFSVIGIAYR